MSRVRSGSVDRRTSFAWGLLAISALAALVVLAGEQALAKRIAGTNGADRIVGTKKADRINARGGADRVKGRAGGDKLKGAKGKDRLVGGKGGDRLNGSKGKDRIKGAKGKDRIKGGKGKDRIVAGNGADRLKAVDGKRDRSVNGGAGKDVCTIDQSDLPALKNCETAKVKQNPPGPGPGPGPDPDELRVKSASGLTCESALPLCRFQIVGDRAEGLVGLVTGHDGVTLAAGATVSIVGDTWTAAGLYGCTDDGYLKVRIGSKSVRVPITCTD